MIQPPPVTGPYANIKQPSLVRVTGDISKKVEDLEEVSILYSIRIRHIREGIDHYCYTILLLLYIVLTIVIYRRLQMQKQEKSSQMCQKLSKTLALPYVY